MTQTRVGTCLTKYLIRISVPLLFLFNAERAGFALEPPRPGEMAALKQTGAYAERLERAKALGNHLIDPDRLAQALNRTRHRPAQQQDLNPAQILPTPPPAWKLMPTKGTVKVFAMLIDFLDYPAYSGNTQRNLQSILFGDGKVNGVLQNPAPYESLTSFYKRASYNQLDLSTGSALGVYHAPYNRSAVAQTNAGRDGLIKEAINYFHGQGVNFAQFDNDGNGQIEYFVVVWTGPDSGWSNFWWAYQTYFSDSAFTVDGKTLGKYSWQWEYNHGNQTSGPFDPRVTIHETGHALGLPDYYDYDDTIGPNGGVGGLDVMDSDWGDHNAFSKWVLDWITPTVVGSGGQNITLNPSGTNPDAVVIMPNATPGGPSGEFFIVQNRYRTGNDPSTTVAGLHDDYTSSAYPTDGILIWHVDATLNPDGTNWAYDNSFTAHKLLKLMQADGLDRIENSNATADPAMYYQPGSTLGPLTNPNSLSYLGIDTGVNVTGLSRSGSLISAAFRIDNPRAMPTLTVVKAGAGDGAVTSDVSGINCGSDCAQSYASATFVTLTATAPGNRFIGWSSGCSGTGTCTVLLTGDTNVMATFDTTLVLNEGFDPPSSSLPAGWTQINSTGSIWRTQYSGCSTSGGTGACVIGTTNGSSASYDSELRTVAMDLSAYQSVGLEFKTSIQTSHETAQVDISLNGSAGPWTNVWNQGGPLLGPQTINIDVTTAAARKTNVMLRFHHFGTNIWWVLDDIKVMGLPLPPGTFSLTAPANGSSDASLTPTLAWTTSSAATSYDVYLGTSTSAPLVGNTVVTSFSPASLVAGKLYYWQIVAKNSAGSNSSATWSFTTLAPPAAPTLISPASGATSVSLTSTLSWNAVGGATSYDVYFGTSSPPPLVTSTTGTSYGPLTLSSGATYYWKIVAKNSAGSTSSDTWSFVTQAPPTAFTLVSPSNGAPGVSLTPTLSWNAANGATSYDVYFGASSPPPFVTNTIGISYSPSKLSSGSTYYWKTVAKNSAGSTSSDTWSFVTQAPPSAFMLLSPTNGAPGVSLTATLSWNAAGGATSYDVYVGLSSSPPLLANTTATSYSAPTLNSGATYYWKVVAKNSVGSTSSDTWSFLTQAPPTAFTLVSPSNRAPGLSLTPTLSWNAANGATSYDVYFGTSSSPPFVTNTTAISYGVGPLSSSATYYWKIVAKNSAGSTSSDTWSFVTQAPPTAFTLVSPSNGAPGVSLTPTLSWNAASGATSYDVYFGTSSSPPFVTSTTGTNYGPPTLNSGATYYWKIVAKNSAGSTSSATWSFATQPPGCSYTLQRTSMSVPASSGNYSADVTAPAGCRWAAWSNVPWLMITSGGAGTGNGTVSFSVQTNTDTAQRSGTLTIVGQTFTVTQSGTSTVQTTGLGFYPITPCRVADTRPYGGKTGPLGPPFMTHNSTRDFPLLSGTCGIPTNAQAYSLNVTVFPHGPLGFLSLWPSGSPFPVVSTLNSFDGSVVANAAIVPAGQGGAVSVYASDDTDVFIDINGYFAPVTSAALAFYPVTPCRVADTRSYGGKSGAFGPPTMGPASTRDIPIPSSSCGIPATAQAYSLNMTAWPTGVLQFMTVWPTGQPRPFVSTLNAYNGGLVANAAVVPAGTNGAMSVFVTDNTEVIVDINGYFAPPGPGALYFYPLTPCRVADTRSYGGKTGAFGPPQMPGGSTRSFPFESSSCSIPNGVQAYSLNVSVWPSGPLGFLTAWPSGPIKPFVSTLNSLAGKVVANAAIVPAGPNGDINIFVTDPTDVFIDINGYFAP